MPLTTGTPYIQSPNQESQTYRRLEILESGSLLQTFRDVLKPYYIIYTLKKELSILAFKLSVVLIIMEAFKRSLRASITFSDSA